MSTARFHVAAGVAAFLAMGLWGGSAQAALPIDGLKLWLKADSIIGVGNGQKVSAWNDSSANGLNLDQPSASLQPVFISNAINEQPAVQFGGSAWLTRTDVTGSSLTSTNQATVFVVQMQPAGSPGNTALYCWASGTLWTDDNRFMLHSAYANQIIFLDGRVTPGMDWPRFAQPQGWYDEYHLLEFSRSGQTFGFIMDGADQGALNNNLGPFDVTATATLSLGRDNWGINFVGNLSELIVYDRALSAEESDTVNAYLGSKYYLVAEPALPGDANRDGQVNVQDLAILAYSYNWYGTWATGDFNGDGLVTVRDLAILAFNYNRSRPPPAVDVPEPATLFLLALGGLAVIRRRRR